MYFWLIEDEAVLLQATMFEGIYRLAPGHRLVWERGQVTVEEYWAGPEARKPIEKVRTGREESSAMRATMAEESSPPLRKAPSGTSLSI